MDTEQKPEKTPRELLIEEMERQVEDPVRAPGDLGWGKLEILGHREFYGFTRQAEVIGEKCLTIEVIGEDGKLQLVGTYGKGSFFGHTPLTKQRVMLTTKWAQDALFKQQQDQRSLPAPAAQERHVPPPTLDADLLPEEAGGDGEEDVGEDQGENCAVCGADYEQDCDIDAHARHEREQDARITDLISEREILIRALEDAVCTCPLGARRGGLFRHLMNCPAELADFARGARQPDGMNCSEEEAWQKLREKVIEVAQGRSLGTRGRAFIQEYRAAAAGGIGLSAIKVNELLGRAEELLDLGDTSPEQLAPLDSLRVKLAGVIDGRQDSSLDQLLERVRDIHETGLMLAREHERAERYRVALFKKVGISEGDHEWSMLVEWVGYEVKRRQKLDALMLLLVNRLETRGKNPETFRLKGMQGALVLMPFCEKLALFLRAGWAEADAICPGRTWQPTLEPGFAPQTIALLDQLLGFDFVASYTHLPTQKPAVEIEDAIEAGTQLVQVGRSLIPPPRFHTAGLEVWLICDRCGHRTNVDLEGRACYSGPRAVCQGTLRRIEPVKDRPLVAIESAACATQDSYDVFQIPEEGMKGDGGRELEPGRRFAVLCVRGGDALLADQTGFPWERLRDGREEWVDARQKVHHMGKLTKSAPMKAQHDGGGDA